MKKNLVLGILAHVDAGKTSLSEAILYMQGVIRKVGRVDHKDTFLDTYHLEKERGITIFSKQAKFETENFNVTLIDTPGHADFSSEMERTLNILDAAILVISAADGITGQVKILIRLLSYYHIPTIIFVNKMDQDGADREKILSEIKAEFKPGILDVENGFNSAEEQENIAVLDEKLMEKFLEGEHITQEDIKTLISKQLLMPICFGSALKHTNISQLIETIDNYISEPVYKDNFSARIFKITRDNNKRLTWMKITGGSLKAKSVINIHDTDEKIDEVRIYSGEKFTTVKEVMAGEICAVTGLTESRIGDVLGEDDYNYSKMLQPVLRCSVEIPDEIDSMIVFKDLKQLEEEEPTLRTVYNSQTGKLSVEIMGEVQEEILKNLVSERFSYHIEFGTPEIVYKETIKNTVEGVGHFEPLRHYAEVHLLLEPAPPGSGIVLDNKCPNDMLSRNYQKLILSHLQEKRFTGVLTNSEITDIKITLIAGRSHEKHTEGGDFREATYRALRQGLMMAENILLEPIMKFSLTVPEQNIGRAMNDISNFGGEFSAPDIKNGSATLTGKVPAEKVSEYPRELNSYTKGEGQIILEFDGYEPCANAEEVIESKGYIAELDTENTASSVFCSHGAGTIVPWDKVREYMHIDTGIGKDANSENDTYETENTFQARKKEDLVKDNRTFKEKERDRMAADAELIEIFERTYGPIKSRTSESNDKPYTGSRGRHDDNYVYKPAKQKNTKKYLLIDGYNMIFAWDELKKLAASDLKAARDKLLDIVSNYAGFVDEEIIVVFDAYKVPGGQRHIYRYNNLDVIFTKEAETADLYIEQAAHELTRKYDVTVATSDAIEQVIIFGAGAQRLSALNFYERVKAVEREIESLID